MVTFNRHVRSGMDLYRFVTTIIAVIVIVVIVPLDIKLLLLDSRDHDLLVGGSVTASHLAAGDDARVDPRALALLDALQVVGPGLGQAAVVLAVVLGPGGGTAGAVGEAPAVADLVGHGGPAEAGVGVFGFFAAAAVAVGGVCLREGAEEGAVGGDAGDDYLQR